jgi:hypothetical protein
MTEQNDYRTTILAALDHAQAASEELDREYGRPSPYDPSVGLIPAARDAVEALVAENAEQRSRTAALEAVIAEANDLLDVVGDRTARIRKVLDMAPSTVLDQMIREAKAEALTEFADAHRVPLALYYDGDGPITVNDLLRKRAAAYRNRTA